LLSTRRATSNAGSNGSIGKRQLLGSLWPRKAQFL